MADRATPQPWFDEAHPFVGRAEPRQALMTAAIAASRGSGGLTFVGGEAGVGKSRLVERVAGQAAEAGLDVWWANCWSDDGAPPLWPWIQFLRIPPVEEEGPAPIRLDQGEPGFALFDAVAALLRRAGATRPRLLVMEDIQWADEASLRLLRFLARELRVSRVLLIATYRDATPPVHDLLTDLGGSRDHLMLRGLAPAEVAELVTRLTCRAPAPAELATLHQRTGGNPLLVRDLVLGAEAPAAGELLRLDVGDGAGRPLSPRQWEVARLVADGLGNEDIAERLTISRRTVETHVDHVRRRLGLDTRTAIASWVIRQRTVAP